MVLLRYNCSVCLFIILFVETEECCDDDEDYEDDEDSEEEEDDEEDDNEDINEDNAGAMAADEVDDGNANSNEVFRKIREILENEGIEKLFPPLDGTAFYLNTCKMNHSCDPNAYVRYVSTVNEGICAEIASIRVVSAGDELLQSYIDQSLPYEARQLSLLDYGFKCNCSLCQRH